MSSAGLATHRQLGYLVRYSAVSIFVLGVDQVILFVSFGVLGWSTTQANLFAFALLTGPAFFVNRRWVWGDNTTGSRLRTQVLPFWLLGIAGLILSIWATAVVVTWSASLADRYVQAVFVNIASIAAYGLVWVIKFVVLTTMVFNRVQTDPSG